MLSEERIVEIKNKHFVMDRYGENFNFIDFARAIETECVKVPEEMRMIPFDTESGESYRCGWNDCRKEMLEAAPQPAQAEKQESAYIALAFAETKEAPEDSPVSFDGPYTVYVVKNGAWEKQEPVKDEPVAEFVEDESAVGRAKFKLLKPLKVGTKLYTHPQPGRAEEVERLRRSVEVLENDNRKMVAHARSLVERIAELEARDRELCNLHASLLVAHGKAKIRIAALEEAAREARPE